MVFGKKSSRKPEDNYQDLHKEKLAGPVGLKVEDADNLVSDKQPEKPQDTRKKKKKKLLRLDPKDEFARLKKIEVRGEVFPKKWSSMVLLTKQRI
tara:strand:- start:168 stop:452 length:285 start_codon:yes stop_codon:yes gene_type:complete